MHSEDYCNQYFEQFIPLSPTYVWGANVCNVKEKSNPKEYFNNLYKAYGSPTSKYTQAYYDKKYTQAMQGSGWVSDCSGFMATIGGTDRTAIGWYNSCVAVGPITTIDKTHSCMVFRGSETSIHHVGYYDAAIGEVLHMSNSDKNFQHGALKTNEWSYWGKPYFINYSSAPSAKLYLKKGIDISSYQKNVNYKALKDAGVEFAILKIIKKDLSPDNLFETHYQGCTANSIEVVSVYNYGYITNTKQAQEAANAVVRTLNGRKIPVYLDIEDQCMTHLGAYIADISNTYQEIIERSGNIYGIYTGLSFYNSFIAPYRSSFKCINWHIARYYKGDTPMTIADKPDERYKPSMITTFWQYTSKGQVSGINGNVDLDVMYAPSKASSSTPTPSPVPQIRPTIRNTVNTGGANLNVRNKPNTSGEVVGKLKNGANVIVYGVDKDTGWLRLSVTENKWCSGNYVSIACQGQVVVENSVYIRSADSKAGEIWGFYKNGEKVKILHQSTNTGWYLTIGITDPSKRGWVSNKFVTLGG